MSKYVVCKAQIVTYFEYDDGNTESKNASRKWILEFSSEFFADNEFENNIFKKFHRIEKYPNHLR